MEEKHTYIVGIDEAGRGPLAGPIAFGAFCMQVSDKKWAKKYFLGARDSKKMSAEKREEIFLRIKKAKNVKYVVVMQSANIIDSKGLSWAIKDSIKKCLKKLKVNPSKTLVLLDGGIKAPAEFVYQKTIIQGDDTELVISLASIAAKVTRDKHMLLMAKKYPKYGFEKHKGYGTLMHRQAIQKYAASSIHRKSFLGNIK
jgi:ribonuclease HII